MTKSRIIDIPRIARESLLMERLPLEGARVIDIGCGEGWLTQLVAPVTSKIIGIDPSATALERANAVKITSNETYLQAPAENLPLNNASTDIAIYYNSLHHVPVALQRKALRETTRVLIEGGLLCIIEPVASGSAYELFRPVDDESDVYDTTYKLILELANGVEFQQVQEELFVDCYTYQNFEQFLDHVTVVDEGRTGVLAGLEDMLRKRFEQLGEAVDGGRRYDQAHRFSLMRKL